MDNELRSDRIKGESLLERCKRASLRTQAWRAAWELGALVRRTATEAPEVHPRLRQAVEALQVLGARLALEDEPEAQPDGLPDTLPVARPRDRSASAPPAERSAEDF
ncbi:MAG: hypothetical protein ACE37K_13385 [Planctomycetota bacterium]